MPRSLFLFRVCWQRWSLQRVNHVLNVGASNIPAFPRSIQRVSNLESNSNSILYRIYIYCFFNMIFGQVNTLVLKTLCGCCTTNSTKLLKKCNLPWMCFWATDDASRLRPPSSLFKTCAIVMQHAFYRSRPVRPIGYRNIHRHRRDSRNQVASSGSVPIQNLPV